MIFPSGTQFLVDEIRETKYNNTLFYEIEISIPLFIK